MQQRSRFQGGAVNHYIITIASDIQHSFNVSLRVRCIDLVKKSVGTFCL